MGKTTRIEWTATRDATGKMTPGATWNPWRGCTKVSPGCASCFMFRDQARYGRDPSVVVRAAPATFNAPLAWERSLIDSEARRFVFTCSWSDWFHETADPWRDEAWSIIRQTPHLTYQVLTKRPERIAEHLPPDWGEGYANVWLGVSVENQHWADRRIPILLDVPTRLRFLSCEPLLKPLDLGRWLAHIQDRQGAASLISWLIVGGESGGRPGHPVRPMKPEWVRSIRDQCAVADVPLFVKQASGPRPGSRGDLPEDLWAVKEMPVAP